MSRRFAKGKGEVNICVLNHLRKMLIIFIDYKAEIMKELSKSRLEMENVRRQLLQQEIALNIQQTDELTRSLSPHPMETSFVDTRSFNGPFFERALKTWT